MQRAAEDRTAADCQPTLFDEHDPPQPRWAEVNTSAVRVENCRPFGGPWLALEWIRQLGLDEFFEPVMPHGQETVPWSVSAMILIIARLCEPSSELSIAEPWSPQTSRPELWGVPSARVDDNRLSRALDQLLPHKEAGETFLKHRLGELFDLEYGLLLCDIASTSFEGRAAGNPLAQRGDSRGQRSDGQPVCLGLLVSRCGMPLGSEVFAGNTADVTAVVTTVVTTDVTADVTTDEHIVEMRERRYGRSDRIGVMDRGMVSEENLQFLKEGGRRDILGTPKPLPQPFEQERLGPGWHEVRAGVEAKLCQSPDDDDETFSF